MAYRIFVDLSAKVERWSKNTAVVFSDGINGSILVSKRTKQETRNWLKNIYPNRRPSFYVFQLFAVLIYLVVRPHLQKINHLVIDQDYSGSEVEGEIKTWLLHFLRRHNPTLRGRFVSFQRVAGSKADIWARKIYKGKQKADKEIDAGEIKAVFFNKKK